MSTEKKSMGLKARKNIANTLTYTLLILLACIILTPIFFVIVTAFKTDAEISFQNFQWLPHALNFDAFVNAWQLVNWPRAFANSFLITVIVVVGSLFFNSLAGYAFSRLEFRGKNVLFVILLMGMMVPAQSIIIPQFIIMRSIPLAGGNHIFGAGGTGLLDSYASLILPFLSGPMGIFLCRQFYSTFPKSLDEAAKIDGASKIQQVTHITLPGLLPTIVLMLILKVGHILDTGFEQVLIFYNPAVYDVGDIIQTYVYRIGLGQANFSLATALGLFNSVVAFILIVGANSVSKKILGRSIW